MVVVSGRCDLLLAAALASAPPATLHAAEPPQRLVSRAVPELSNSITASRDTNVSPGEIYDFLRKTKDIRPEAILGPRESVDRRGRALDLGAGAGASTQVLWDAGWAQVVAVDPSRLAWDKFTDPARLPASVQFYHASDEQYLERWEA